MPVRVRDAGEPRARLVRFVKVGQVKIEKWE